MVFWISIISIFIISVLLAVRSLFVEIEHAKHLKKIKKHLAKEKILFQKD